MASPSSFPSTGAEAHSDYTHSGRASSSAGAAPDDGYWSIDKCKKAYTQYIANKSQEIEEQKNARRYYHGVHWTSEQVRELNKRKQPIVTFNRIARKLNGVVGLIDRLKQDPKAYPRTPRSAEQAELATAVLRFLLDDGNWNAKSPKVALDASIEGFAGISLKLEKSDRELEDDGMSMPGHSGGPQMGKPDHNVLFEVVKADSFFYDPRSCESDFSDARYMGEAKWLDLETAQEMFPEHADELAASVEDSSDLSTNPDRETKFFAFDGGKHLIRMVDIWYQHKGKWCWSMFTGSMVLDSGESYLFDENNKTICRYIMFSCNVDHDSDRYGFRSGET